MNHRVGDAADRLVSARASHDGRDYEVSSGEMSGGGAVVRCVDITERLRDETALRQGQKMEAVKTSTASTWNDVKAGADSAMQSVKQTYEKAKASLP